MTQLLDEIESCVPALRRYARALTRDADRADDLVQDCLERAIRKRSLFASPGTVRGWLFRILVNHWRNQARSQRRRGDHMALDEMLVEPSVPAAQHGRIALSEMSRAIDKLPTDQREVLLLVALEGVSYGEVATILDIPVGTVMSRLSRARATLRSLTGNGNEPRLRSVK
ncbi:sigma-70 family RNA polymerase sigma factor [Devosia sp.]|uniref:sigma-70 family RNA polymerase sigma factor n=1 Tax=Devosia sp. TaxID=1871048 RepID=UPI003A8FE58C